MARAVEERRTTATTRRGPAQCGQWRTSAPKVRRSSSAQGMGRRGLRREDGGGGEATWSVEVERGEAAFSVMLGLALEALGTDRWTALARRLGLDVVAA